MLRYPLFVLAWFLLILGPIVRSPLGSLGDVSVLSAAGYLLWSTIRGRRLDRSLLPYIALAVAIAFIAGVNSAFTLHAMNSGAVLPMLRPIKAVVELLGLYFAIRYLSREHVRELGARRAYEVLLLAAYLVLVVHAIIILLQFAYPTFRDFTYAVLLDFNVLEYNKTFRMPGLAGAGGAQLSAVQGLGFMIGVHLAVVTRRYLPFLVGNILLIASFVLTGRTGFVLVGLAIAYLATISIWREGRNAAHEWPRRRALGVVFALTCAFLVIRYVPRMYASFSESSTLSIAVERSFRTYLNYKESGQVTDETIGELNNMYAIPSTAGQLLVGDAVEYDNTGGVYSSDLGYVRQLFGYGIVGLALHIAFYCLMGWAISRPRVLAVMGTRNVAFGAWSLIAIFVLNYKESFFFSRMSYPISVIAIMGLSWLSQDGERVNPTSDMCASVPAGGPTCHA